MLLGGITFLIVTIVRKPKVQDGEFLTSIGKWVLNDNENVVWEFSEIGKGTLTTDGHLNDYNFTWALEDGKLKIRTDWLYALDNQYDYSLDQNAKVLTLQDGDKISVFVAVPDTENSSEPEPSEITNPEEATE